MKNLQFRVQEKNFSSVPVVFLFFVSLVPGFRGGDFVRDFFATLRVLRLVNVYETRSAPF